MVTKVEGRLVQASQFIAVGAVNDGGQGFVIQQVFHVAVVR